MVLEMKKARFFIAVAWLIHAVAWFLPVTKESVTLPHGLPGWQAFRVAMCAVWPYADWSIDRWYNVLLATVSAATTILFIFGSVWVVWAGSDTLRRTSAWLAISAFVMNSHWVLRFGSGASDLSIGYFLWWFSFLLLAIGLLHLSRPRDENGKTFVIGPSHSLKGFLA